MWKPSRSDPHGLRGGSPISLRSAPMPSGPAKNGPPAPHCLNGCHSACRRGRCFGGHCLRRARHTTLRPPPGMSAATGQALTRKRHHTRCAEARVPRDPLDGCAGGSVKEPSADSLRTPHGANADRVRAMLHHHYNNTNAAPAQHRCNTGGREPLSTFGRIPPKDG